MLRRLCQASSITLETIQVLLYDGIQSVVISVHRVSHGRSGNNSKQIHKNNNQNIKKNTQEKHVVGMVASPT